MSLNDNAVLTAAVGWVYTAPVGTASPTPAQIKAFEASAFGDAGGDKVIVSAGTGGTFTVTVGGQTTAPLAFNVALAAFKAAVEGLSSVGVGKVTVTGTTAATPGLTVKFDSSVVGTLSVDGTSLTGGTVTVTTKPGTGTGAAWTNVGHTSRGDLPEFGFEGGDTEVKGTWQNESLREIVTDPIADYLTLLLHQFDTESFELYYGKNSSTTPGVFGVAGGTPAPIEKALLIVIVDGTHKVAFYSPKASVRRDDSISLAVDEFSALPVRATFLKYASANKFEWVAEGLFK